VPLGHWIVLSVVLFAIGGLGVATRRNALIVLMSLEIMLNAVNLAFLAFARARADPTAHAVVFIVMAVAAAEVAVGLALAIAMVRTHGTVDLDRASRLKG
jgi:NADH-quinone oxidoreductase subunit K